MSLFPRLWDRVDNTRSVRQARPTVEALEDRALPSASPGVSAVSTIVSNFNGTAIPAGDTVWFNSVAKVSGVPASGATLEVSNSEIDFTANGQAYQVAAPNVNLTFAAATEATTSFDAASNTWSTTVPLKPSGNVFLDGVALPVPAGLPGGIKNVSWTATFQSSTGSLQVNWQWAAAAYTSFGTDPNSLGVKPSDSPTSLYKSSDHAGTPEAYRDFVGGGARGGGGSNWTGSYSGTASVQAAALGSLSGFVFDQSGAPVAGATITLTWTDLSGTVHTQSAMTNGQGAFSFTGLTAGTYTLTQTPPTPYTAFLATLGTVNGNTEGTPTSNGSIDSVNLPPGNNGVNYIFYDTLNGGFGGS